MATLTVETISRDGLTVTMNAAEAGGDDFVNDGTIFVEVDNAGGGSVVATFVTTKTVDSQAVADRTVTIPAGERRLVGPFTTAYEDGSRKVAITYDGVTSVTVGVMKVGT